MGVNGLRARVRTGMRGRCKDGRGDDGWSLEVPSSVCESGNWRREATGWMEASGRGRGEGLESMGPGADSWGLLGWLLCPLCPLCT